VDKRAALKSVSRASPCVVCDAIDGCSADRDDGYFLCRRRSGDQPGFVFLGQATKDPQYACYRRMADAARRGNGKPGPGFPGKPFGRSNYKQTVDWQARAEGFAANLTPERMRQLAELLGVPEAAVARLPLVGWCDCGPHKGDDGKPLGGCWTFAEVDGDGKVIGICCRYLNGQKKTLAGSQRGLIVPSGWSDGDGPVFVVEGASDVLAMVAMGHCTIGRPNNTGGAEQAAKLLRSLPAARQIIVMGEVDPKPDGTWPGLDGQMKVSADLQRSLTRPVSRAMPPAMTKDVRSWLTGKNPDLTCADELGELGDRFVAGLKVLGVDQQATLEPTFPTPVVLSELTALDLGDSWRLHGYLAVGSITLLTALWKSGKTTLISRLLRSFGDGSDFIGREVKACSVLVVSEEPNQLWVERRDELNLGDHVQVMPRPLKGKPTLPIWTAFILHLVECVKASGFNVVIFDTLSQFWPVVNENDASEVTAAMMPLRMLCDAGVAVLLIHHPRKSDGQEGTAARGSGALPGFVDILLELRRYEATKSDDRRRVLTGYSRYAATPQELVIELTPNGLTYTCLGDKKATRNAESVGTIVGLLPLQPPGATTDEILEGWPNDNKPGKRTLEGWLENDLGKSWFHTGSGKKNDPRRFYAVAPGTKDEEAI